MTHKEEVLRWEQTRESNDTPQNIRDQVVLNGITFLWFILTGLSVLFVAVDIRSTPESPVLKWGFVLLTAYTGPVGAFLYVLGCREPLPETHEQYVKVRWRQVLGSTMHCVAGDGAGILAGAVIGAVTQLPPGNRGLLVCDVDGALDRVHHGLPSKLVARLEGSKARHDDHSTGNPWFRSQRWKLA